MRNKRCIGRWSSRRHTLIFSGYASSLSRMRSEEHTSELQSPCNLVCRLLLEKKKNKAFHFFWLHRAEFLQHYHPRSMVESTFSMVKRKFGDSVRPKNDQAIKNEVLSKIVCDY